MEMNEGEGLSLARSALLTAFCLVILCPLSPSSRAAPGSEFVVRRVDLSTVLRNNGGDKRLFAYNEGEVVAVEPQGCVLRTEDGARRFALRPECPVFVNGHRSVPWAMRPVSPEAFFWAGIWFRAEEAAAVEAVYCGGELMVLESSPGGFVGWSPEIKAVFHLPVRPGKTVEYLHPGQIVYVLLDLEGRVRWAKSLGNP